MPQPPRTAKVLTPFNEVKQTLNMSAQKTVLITGCSEGGLGDALARAFHAKGGYRVFASARNPAKMAHFAALGIETAILDVQSAASVAKCVADIASRTGGSLDILLNNSGAGYNMPIADASLEATRDLFELNVFAPIQVTQAFLPLLLKAKPGNAMIVNHTSISAVTALPTQGVYSASKAAFSALTETLRLELQPFNIKVIDLRTGGVRSRFFTNLKGNDDSKLPKDSIYGVAREKLESIMNGEAFDISFDDADVWAKRVVGDLSVANPSFRVWRGGSAWQVWAGRAFLPHWFFDNMMKKIGGMDVVEAGLKAEQKSR